MQIVNELIRPIDTRRLYQVIADRVRGLIQSGEFPSLSRLPAERDLAQRLGVSRPSLREALIALEIDGSVEIRMGSGVYVMAARAPADAQVASLGDSPSEIMQARVALEGPVVLMACARINPDSIVDLRASLQSMRRVIEEGGVPLEQDRAFHVLLASQTGNSVLVRLVAELFDGRQGKILAKLSLKFDTRDAWLTALAEHEKIVAGLEAADPLRAEAAMRAHLLNSAERWLGI